MTTTEHLDRIHSPADLRKLDWRDLKPIADELRAFVLESVSKTGGHLSSNLGTVELTLALHYVFDTPHDRIVWDVGHQSYPHKILTGRREGMAQLRQQGGISGFPKRSESEYDAFGTAHSSTSISAALGMAVASRNAGVARQHIAVIGDGAMSAGMAFEAMNNAGVTPNVNLLVILNDNDMSISPPVGALNRYLARLMSGRFYAAAKNVGRAVLQHVPPVLELARRLEEHAKGMITPATLFEEFGFNYVGPIDGHDLDALVPTLQNLKALQGLQFLHVVTRKGQGYKLAEADPVLYHGPGKFDPAVGIQKAKTPAKQTFTQVFGQWLCDQAQADARLVGITPAMREGSGLVEFEKRFPTRYFDVGIAEQHAVTFAGGLACEGQKPVVAIYSTFLQRGYDQLIHDVALQNLDVTFALDRAGLVGADGATHAGNYDIASCVACPTWWWPRPPTRTKRACCCRPVTPIRVRPPCATRAARAAAPRSPRAWTPCRWARAWCAGAAARSRCWASAPWCGRPGCGRKAGCHRGRYALCQAAGPRIAARAGRRPRRPGHDRGGRGHGRRGQRRDRSLNDMGLTVPVLQLGLPDEFIDHGDQAALLAGLGLDAAGIERSVRERFSALLHCQ